MATRSERTKRARQAFISLHPFCCFCGGHTPTEEMEHLPSRACFDEKMYPDGFEFPACRACNAGTSVAEQVVAWLSRTLSNPSAPALECEIAKYMSGVSNNSREAFRELGEGMVKFSCGGGVLHIGDNVRQAVDQVVRKWAKAFHYKETGRIVPSTAQIYVQWWTNAAGTIPAEVFNGKARSLTRNGRDLGDQMAYISLVDPDADPDLGRYTVAFRRSFLAVMLVDFHGRVLTIPSADGE